MRAKVQRLEVDIDLIASNDDMLEAVGAAINAGFDFDAQRAGGRGETKGFPGLVQTQLTDPGVFLGDVIASLVVLEAALDETTPDEVLQQVRRKLTAPGKKIPAAQMMAVEPETSS